MVFRSELQLHRSEAAKRRRLKRLWAGGWERVEMPSTEIGRNQQITDFTKDTPKCIYCGGESKEEGRATDYSVFYRCRICDKIFEALG